MKRKPKESIIVIDPHGDLVDEIARLKCFKSPKRVKRLVYIDP